MAEWDTAALLEDVKERGSLPANDTRFTNAKVLAAATLELREGVAPMLSSSRAEYLVYTDTQTVVSGQAAYRMHPRAVGGTLRNVYWKDAAGNPTRLRELSMDEVEQIGNSTTGNTPFGYYVRNYYVVLVPTPNVAGSVELPYYARPNRLVLPTAVGVVDAVDNLGGGRALVQIPDDPPVSDQLAAAPRIDIIRATPGFETLLVNTAPTTVSGGGGSPVAFDVSGVDGLVAVGDYVCLPGEAPVPQVPVELHGLLAARTARRLVKAVGDDRYQALSEDVAELEAMARDWLTQRVAGQTQQAGGQIGGNGLGPFGAWWQW